MVRTLVFFLRPRRSLVEACELLLIDSRPVILNRRLGLAPWRGLLFALASEKY